MAGLLAAGLVPACLQDGTPTPTPAAPTPTPQINGDLMTLLLANYPALTASNGSAGFDTPFGAVIVAHLGSGAGSSYVCLSRVCPADGCLVNFDPTIDGFRCPCDDSTFATNGAVTTGGAPAPLFPYPTTTSAGQLVVNFGS
jgi:cytochrome b6-f complex iron-sulfur subunit